MSVIKKFSLRFFQWIRKCFKSPSPIPVETAVEACPVRTEPKPTSESKEPSSVSVQIPILSIVQVSSAKAVPNERHQSSGPSGAKADKKQTTHKQRPAVGQAINLSEEVRLSGGVCWRATGLHECNGDPIIYAPGLGRSIPLIRVIYAANMAVEPPERLIPGCCLHGEKRNGCVNPFPHQAKSGFIYVAVENGSLLRIHQGGTRAPLYIIPPPVPCLYRQPLSDELADDVSKLQKLRHDKLRQNVHYCAKGITKADYAKWLKWPPVRVDKALKAEKRLYR